MFTARHLMLTPLGANLITNGDFASGTVNPWTVVLAGTIAVEAGSLRYNSGVWYGTNGGMLRFAMLGIEVGGRYDVQFEVKDSTTNGLCVGINPPGSFGGSGANIVKVQGAVGLHRVTLIPYAANQTSLHFFTDTAAPASWLLDNISVRRF